MQYFGLFHDGPVWPLYPEVQYLPLSPTWTDYAWSSGDNIGDCLGSFTLPEAATQSRLMSVKWQKVLAFLEQHRAKHEKNPVKSRELDLAQAIGILLIPLIGAVGLRMGICKSGSPCTLVTGRSYRGHPLFRLKFIFSYFF